MSTDFPGLRAGLCAFTFSDGRCCANLRHPTHPHLCLPHARKEAAQLAEQQAGVSLCQEIKRNYVTATDLTWTISRVFEAVASGQIKPRTAKTLAYLAQIMAQTIPLAQHEFVSSLGHKSWAECVSESLNFEGNPRYDEPPEEEHTEDQADEPQADDAAEDANEVQ
jgi:hypothetical protein